MCRGNLSHLLGISLLVIGSYPTQETPAFSQLAQLGSFWSHLFFRNLHRLQALTLRKLLLCPTLEPWPSKGVSGEGAPAVLGESLSGEDWR